jgi:hypothetical protein
MNAGPDRAVGIVKNLGCHGAQQQTTKHAVAVGGHDDQLTLLIVRETDDLARRIAFQQNALNPIGHVAFDKSVERLTGVLAERLKTCLEHSGSLETDRTSGRLKHVHYPQFGIEVRCKVTCEQGSRVA